MTNFIPQNDSDYLLLSPLFANLRIGIVIATMASLMSVRLAEATCLQLTTTVADSDIAAETSNRLQAASNLTAIGRSPHNMVASVHPLATQAGLNAFQDGGNAIDAAVATALTLGVVDGFNSGIGGGCFILIRLASGEFVAIDGREMAPAAAHRDMFLKDGIAQPQLSQTGALAIGIPGSLAAYHEVLNRYGKRSLREAILPGAAIAAEGFAICKQYASRLKLVQTELQQFPASRQIFLNPDGMPYLAGQKLVQADLADTYRQIAKHGSAWFYNGPFALKAQRWSEENGGIFNARDFANYQIIQRQPLITNYRDYQIIGFPPPSSGGVHVAQILNILENFELRNQDNHQFQQSLHIVAEAMKLAFADRAYWLGDPDYVDVPRGLIDKQYAKQLAQRIDVAAATPVNSQGVPPRADNDFFEKHTTHLTAVDSDGNWVAITATLNTTFGSKVVIPSTGVMMNNQMDDFSIAPGVPNAFGLVGGENNAVDGGKRPLSSMSPTIVVSQGQPVMTVGAAGGPTIISQSLWTIVQVLDFGIPINQAVGYPRLHHQWSPDILRVENGMHDSVYQSLQTKGHRLEKTDTIGITQAIGYDSNLGIFIGVSDPRISGAAGGVDPSVQPVEGGKD